MSMWWCPTEIISANSDKYHHHAIHISIFKYWHDPFQRDKYVEVSEFIAEINNEGEVKNMTYKANLENLENFVMIKSEDVSIKTLSDQ